jgi:hypothetical protein
MTARLNLVRSQHADFGFCRIVRTVVEAWPGRV